MPQSIVASAPGSLMLFGEHAVLRGKQAIVAAVEPRVIITLTPSSDKTITIHSSLGTASTSIDSISFGKTFRFMEKALLLFQNKLPSGANINVESHINPTMGLGSSAAITVATLACVNKWLNESCTSENLLLQAKDVISSVQGCGSGADAAASIWGGVIAYTANPIAITTLRKDLPLTLLYSGKKTPTPEVIAYVNNLEEEFPSIFASVFTAMEKTTEKASRSIRDGNWTKTGKLMDIQHGLLEALLVGTPELSAAYWELKRSSTIFGAKISGSGLGDSVLGLGSSSSGSPVTVSSQGVVIS